MIIITVVPSNDDIIYYGLENIILSHANAIFRKGKLHSFSNELYFMDLEIDNADDSELVAFTKKVSKLFMRVSIRDKDISEQK